MDFSILAGKTNLRIWLWSFLSIEFTKGVSGVTCTLVLKEKTNTIKTTDSLICEDQRECLMKLKFSFQTEGPLENKAPIWYTNTR